MSDVDPAETIATVCEAVSADAADDARREIAERYPHTPILAAGRRYSKSQSVTVFVRDGFTDRYSGKRLVFPGTLRLLSLLFPVELPFHRNWKMEACHPMYWELSPTIDHVVPVARGGVDEASNWVSTSMLRNAAKANWTLDELGWELRPPGDMNAWDGLTRWCLDISPTQPESIGRDLGLRQWNAAARRVLAEER